MQLRASKSYEVVLTPRERGGSESEGWVKGRQGFQVSKAWRREGVRHAERPP